jgi:hypothetical protein
MLSKVTTFALSLAVVVSLCGCATTASRVVVGGCHDPFPAEEKLRFGFLAHNFLETEESVRFRTQTTENWKTKYDEFSQALVRKATDRGFDSASLAKIMKLVLEDAEHEKCAYLPVGAYVTTQESDLVWIVEVNWASDLLPRSDGKQWTMSHVRAYAFDQKTLKQMGFATCD